MVKGRRTFSGVLSRTDKVFVMYAVVGVQQMAAKLHTIFRHAIQNSITSVPAVTSTSPTAAFLVSFSLRKTAEKRIVTKMLSLSMGATTLAGPS